MDLADFQTFQYFQTLKFLKNLQIVKNCLTVEYSVDSNECIALKNAK